MPVSTHITLTFSFAFKLSTYHLTLTRAVSLSQLQSCFCHHQVISQNSFLSISSYGLTLKYLSLHYWFFLLWILSNWNLHPFILTSLSIPFLLRSGCLRINNFLFINIQSVWTTSIFFNIFGLIIFIQWKIWLFDRLMLMTVMYDWLHIDTLYPFANKRWYFFFCYIFVFEYCFSPLYDMV